MLHANDADFEQMVLQSDVPVIVDFHATWCGPCKMIAPSVEAISSDYEGKAKVVKVDIDNAKQTALKYQIMSVPTLMFFKDGQIADQIVGAVPKNAIEEKLSSLI